MFTTHHQSITGLCVEFGVKNIVAQIPTSPLEFAGFIPGIAIKSGENIEVGLFTICEDRYVVKEEYKVEFAPTIMRYGKERFYISDFNSLWERGFVRLFVVSADGDAFTYRRVLHPEAETLGDWSGYRYIQEHGVFSILPAPEETFHAC